MGTIRQLSTALWTLLALTIVTGVLYPLVVWGVGQIAFADQANGSLIERDGKPVASKNIGQYFGDPGDTKTAKWFRSRPSSAAGAEENDPPYNALNSYGSNLGPENPDLIKAIKELKAAIAKEDKVPESKVPADAVTGSSSGLDPHISPTYAEIQVKRVADTRGISEAEVRKLVEENTSGPMWGLLGEDVVNVNTLNLALESRG